MSDVWYCIDESDTGDWVTSIWDGLGIPAAQIPSTGESGAAYLFNDIAGQGASPNDEFSSTILTVPPVGVFTHDEYSALSFTGAGDGVYTATYMAERNGVPYLNPSTVGGEWVITMTIGSPSGATVNATFPQLTVAASAASVAPAPSDDSSASIGVTFSKFSASVSASFNAPDSSAIVSTAFPKFAAFVIAGPKSLNAASSVSASFPAFSASATVSHDSQRLYGDIGTMPWQLAIANKRFTN